MGGYKFVNGDINVTAENVEIINDEFIKRASMIKARYSFGCTHYKDCIYVAGGDNGEGSLKSCEKYNSSLDTWS
jgi:hypothetical protein